MPNSKITFIDLFTGIGGSHQAMTSLGGRCVLKSDIDEDCFKTYEINYGIKPSGDITKIDATDISAHDVSCAGLLCQTFSTGGEKSVLRMKQKGDFFDANRII